MQNNVKMRSKDTKGNVVEVRDFTKKIQKIHGYDIRPEFKVYANNQIYNTTSFTEAKNIFKWALTQ